jgi:hypothetical protein
MLGPELTTTTSNSVDIISTDNSNSSLRNDTQMLSDNQEYLILVTAPTASVGGLLVLIAAVVLVAGIAVCWRRGYKQRRSINLPPAVTNGNELQDTSRDQRSPFTQSRGAPDNSIVTGNNNYTFDIKENIAYQGYNFDEIEHVYAQPHAHHLKTHRDYERNDYEIPSYY